MEGNPGEVTVLLKKWAAGDRAAEAQLFELLMPELRKKARNCFRGERVDHTLQPTALVNEVFLRLVKAKSIDWQDRGHFLNLAARMMRRLLIDHARSQPSVLFLPMEGLPERILGSYAPREIQLAIDTLLDELEKESPQGRALVELKYFLGATDEEAAEALHLSLRSTQRKWLRTRRWLFERLTKEPPEPASNALKE